MMIASMDMNSERPYTLMLSINKSIKKRYLTEDNITDYIKEIRRAVTSGGEIELIELSELHKINVLIWNLLTQVEPKLKL